MDGTAEEYTIYGSSHHPGWSNLDFELFGENRTMYLYKAKAKSTSNQDAKLYLALPLETRDNITGLWKEDSVGEVVTSYLTGQVNTIINRLLDATDDSESEDEIYTGDAAYEQTMARNLVTWITGNDPETTSEDYVIEKDQLENFVHTDTTPGAEDFRNGYKSIEYMINPAYYDTVSGFLGTYDEKSDQFYAYDNGTLSEGDKPSNFDLLDGLDLSDIDPYVPSEVVGATITIE